MSERARDRLSRIRRVVDALRRERFPELVGLRLELRGLRSRRHFFAASVCWRSLARPARERTYLLHVHARLVAAPPPEPALRAILAHELAHVLDYAGRSLGSLLALAARYGADAAFRRSYERAADLVVVERGLGPELSRYRHWLYAQLPADVVREKRRVYLTPDEIAPLLGVRPAPVAAPVRPGGREGR